MRIQATPASTSERLELLLSRAELRVRELQQLLTVAEDPDRPEAPSTEDFARVLTAIKAKWPDSERLALITDMGRSGHYASAQVRAMLETFDFDDNKVEAAIRLYPKLTDPENFFQALEAIDSSFKRDEVRTKLNLK
jgi:lipoate synthase